MRRTVLPAAAVALMLAGCSRPVASVNTTPAPNTPSTTAAAQAATTPTPSKPSKQAKVGDTVTIAARDTHLAVTLVKIVDPAKGADDFSVPAKGKHFIAVQIRVTNTGTAVYSDNPVVDVKAKNAAGESMSMAFATTTAGADMPSSVDLVPGDTALGFVDFEVPDGQKIAQVQYALFSFGGDNVAQWTIG